MGRTIPSFRIAAVIEEKTWKQYRKYLNNKNDRKVFDKTKQDNRRSLQNNVIEQSGFTRNQKGIEESSSSRTLPTAYDIKDAETTTQEEDVEDLRGNEEEIYHKTFVDRLIKENAKLVDSFTFEYDLEV